MSIEIEIHPGLRASALRTTQQPTIEGPRFGDIMDRNGEVERVQGHRRGMTHAAAEFKRTALLFNGNTHASRGRRLLMLKM
jgi:hypothetical protein